MAIDLSEVVNDPDLIQDITIERTTGGHFEKSAYVTNAPTRFTIQAIFDPDKIKEVMPTPEGSRATGHITVLLDRSISLFTTHDRADGNDIADKIIFDPGKPYEVAFRIISTNESYGVQVVDAERVGAI